MADPSTLRALLERVKSATGPDTRLDLAVHMALHPSDFPDRWSWDDDRPLRITASLDAALALVERVMPGCFWDLERDYIYDAGHLAPRSVARVRVAMTARLHVQVGATPALALLAAMLEAQIMEADHGA